ncbi:hypothetical protein DPX16_1619 [Anabarilius grahami]|uniref:Uncharacterized protein n=1 Tax=Anabarilius grahami TaxID=495550 RepID=A0A3N0YGA2_ANAGA|nr:hypothetical protein DPX16_1619 [Anabarilius grahami]
MERAKPWHPFRVPGMCGLRGSNCILTVLAVLICGVIMFLTAEIVKMTRVTVMGSNDNMDEDHRLDQKNTFLRRIRRATATLLIPTRGLEESIITVEEGSSVQFDCNPFEKNCLGCRDQDTTSYAQAYFCKEPCKWADVKAYTDPASYGTDERFQVTKNSRHGNNRDGMRVSMTAVKLSDQGKFFCGIDKEGTDWYEAFSVIVRKPAPVRPNIGPVFEPATKEELTWMGSDGAVDRDVEEGRVPMKGPAPFCTVNYVHDKPDIPIPPLRVTHRQGDVCVCQKEDIYGRTEPTGRSDCRVRIDFGGGKQTICSAAISGVTRNFTCPFGELQDTSPAAVWVCGDKAYHYMPKGSWKGCCYPALMDVGTSVYLPHDDMFLEWTERAIDVSGTTSDETSG